MHVINSGAKVFQFKAWARIALVNAREYRARGEVALVSFELATAAHCRAKIDEIRTRNAAADSVAAAWHDADKHWMQALEMAFGSRASDMRYKPEGKGAPGSALRALHDEFDRLRKAYLAAIQMH